MKSLRLLAVVTAFVALAGCAKRDAGTISNSPGTDGTQITQDGSFAPGGPANVPDRAPITDDETIKAINAELQPVFFAFDRSDLTEEARTTLRANADVMRRESGRKFVVEGHCDERGTNEYNLALGDRRANAARDFLVRSGVESSRLSTVSYGEEKPFATGHDESSWAQNRRAHFRVDTTAMMARR